MSSTSDSRVETLMFREWVGDDAGPEERYRAFAALWRAHVGDVTRTCAEATTVMVELCPELRRVRGTVVMVDAPDGDTRPWPHWWCATEDGTVVDPTRSQFPCPDLVYEEVDDSHGEPTGRCPNCGGLCYAGRYLCSEKCEREYLAYVNGSTSQFADDHDYFEDE